MGKKIVKISTPFGIVFSNQINPELLSTYTFEIDNECDKCDYWIVWGDIPPGSEKMSVNCPPSNVYYLADEAYEDKNFDQRFLDQFPGVITCRNDITHNTIIKTHEINVWQLKKNFSEVNNTNPIPKQKRLSVVCSDKTFLPGHKKRFAFVNKLIGHFKDRIDVFGRGFNPIDDKWEALAPYEYSIAIENSALPGYFTEKITECYLAHTFPIYYGAPDIDRYFDSHSYMTIDIDDFIGSVQKIERLLEEKSWKNSEELLIRQKLLYLSEYHFFPALCKALQKIRPADAKSKKNTVKSHRSFGKYYKVRKLLSAAKKRFDS